MNKSLTQVKGGSVNTSLQSPIKSIENFLNLSVSTNTVAQNMAQLSYHELEDVPVREIDEVEQLEKNVQTLSELRTRLQFLNREIRYLMKI